MSFKLGATLLKWTSKLEIFKTHVYMFETIYTILKSIHACIMYIYVYMCVIYKCFRFYDSTKTICIQ